MNEDQMNINERLFKEREVLLAKVQKMYEVVRKSMNQLKLATDEFDMKNTLNASSPLKYVKNVKGLPK